jgi:hypothetical protein
MTRFFVPANKSYSPLFTNRNQCMDRFELRKMQLKRGMLVVPGNKELFEKLVRNHPCPCLSGRSFQEQL